MVGIRAGIKLERDCLNEPTPVRLQTATARWQLWKLGPKLMCGELDLTGEKDCFSYPSHKGLQRDSGEDLWSPADEIKPPKTKPRDASFPSGASYYPPILPAGLSAVCSALSPVSPSPVTSLCCRAPSAKGTGSPQRLTEHPPRHSPSFRESKEHQQSPGEQLQCSTCWFGAPAHCWNILPCPDSIQITLPPPGLCPLLALRASPACWSQRKELEENSTAENRHKGLPDLLRDFKHDLTFLKLNFERVLLSFSGINLPSQNALWTASSISASTRILLNAGTGSYPVYPACPQPQTPDPCLVPHTALWQDHFTILIFWMLKWA